jgi:hypothetical protein
MDQWAGEDMSQKKLKTDPSSTNFKPSPVPSCLSGDLSYSVIVERGCIVVGMIAVFTYSAAYNMLDFR